MAFGWGQAEFEGLHLYVFLIFDVLFDDCQGRTPHSGDEIRISPESRKPAFQSRELRTKQERTTTLDALHKFMNSELWIDFTKELNDFLPPNIYAIYQNLAAILWAENNRVLAGVKNILMAFVCELRGHRDNYTTIRCIVKQNRALYPRAIRRGFYGASDKK